MVRATVMVLCLLGMSPVLRGKECFDFNRFFLSMKSDEQGAKVLDEFQNSLVDFFYIKGEHDPELPLSISWSTARELARYLEKKGFDIRVREDIHSEARESVFNLAAGGAFVAGFALGAYGSPKLKEVVQKFVVSKRLVLGSGIMGGAGVIVGSWFGGPALFEGSCNLTFRHYSIVGGTAPLRDLGVHLDMDAITDRFEQSSSDEPMPCDQMEAIVDEQAMFP